jgi:hypothetical protein
MIKQLMTIAAILICSQQLFAQKASDVLENGEPVKKGHRLFLKYDFTDNVFKVDAAKNDQDVDFTTLEDSIIFLVRKNAINIYLRPLNPLSYSYETESKIVIDPINHAAEIALGEVIGTLGTVIVEPRSNVPVKRRSTKPVEFAATTTTTTTALKICQEFTDLKTAIEYIQKELLDSKKENISKTFESLKAITFVDEGSTIRVLNSVEDSIKTIEDHFKQITDTIKGTQSRVNIYHEPIPEPFIAKYIFNDILKELSVKVDEQKKRLAYIIAAYKLVKEMQEKASAGGGTDKLKWCLPLKEVASKEGKISIYTVTIKESGYKLSDNNEIISVEPNELTKRSIRIRKFQRFVPEVSVGTAFTFLKYYSYGTTSDSTGQQYVSTPTENAIKNLNIATMLNYNYYIPNSLVHPLYQLGVGINSGMPTILTGIGLRSNINGTKRLAISGGLAMTWVKELNTLKVGDKITGTSDIDKDYKYSSAPKFTPYIALQYNF